MWVKDYTKLSCKDIIDFSSSLSFDLTITVCIVPLLYGATISLCDLHIKQNPHQYLEYLIQSQQFPK